MHISASPVHLGVIILWMKNYHGNHPWSCLCPGAAELQCMPPKRALPLAKVALGGGAWDGSGG